MEDNNEVLEAVLKETVDLENVPIEEVFENLRCSREGLTTQAADERGLLSLAITSSKRRR